MQQSTNLASLTPATIEHLQRLQSLGLGYAKRCLWTPDSQHLIVETGYEVLIYDAVNFDTPPRHFASLSDMSSLIALSPDGSLLAVGDGGSSSHSTNDEVTFPTRISLYDMPAGNVIGTLIGQAFSIQRLVFSPNSRLLATSDSQETWLWDIQTGRVIGKLPYKADKMVFDAKSSSLFYIARTSPGFKICRWEVNTQQHFDLGITIANPYYVVFQVNATQTLLLYSDREAGKVYLYDLENGSQWLVTEYQRYPWVEKMALSPVGDKLALFGMDGTLSIYDIATQQCTNSVATTDTPPTTPSAQMVGLPLEMLSVALTLSGAAVVLQTLTFSPDGHWLVGTTLTAVFLWKADTLQLVASYQYVFGLNRVLFSPNSAWMTIDAGSLWVWNVHQAKPFPLAGHTPMLTSLAVSASGRYVAAGYSHGHEGGMVNLWNITNGAFQTFIPQAHSNSNSVAISPDETTLAVGGLNGLITLWNLDDAEPARVLESFRTLKNYVVGLAFSPDGQLLATGDKNEVRLWDTSSWEPMVVWQGFSVNRLLFSSDGDWLVGNDYAYAEGRDNYGIVQVWNVAAQKLMHRLEFENSTAPLMAFASDGLLAVVTSPHRSDSITDSFTLFLVDLTTGNRHLILETTLDHRGQLTAVGFSVDRRLFACATRKTVTIWEMETRRKIKVLATDRAIEFVHLAFSPNGKQFITADWLGIVHLWGVPAQLGI